MSENARFERSRGAPSLAQIFQEAVALHQRGNLAKAIGLYQAVLAQDPRNAAGHVNLGHALAGMGRNEEAIVHYLRALEIEPNSPEALINFGNALQAAGRHEEAILRYQQALVLNPNAPEALLNIGNALQILGRVPEAVARYRDALALRPFYAEAHYHLGLALEKIGRSEEAAAHYERAIAIKPDYADPHNNLGNILRALNRDAEAIAHFEQALAIKPDYAEAHWNEGAALLTIGDYEAGWLKNEWRRLLGVVRPRVAEPLWLGGWDLSGKTILLYAEQGLGDSLQFARYVPLVALRGANVVLEVQPELASLMKSLRGVATVRARGEPLPRVDCQCPLLSLPRNFATRLDTIPAEVPYLHAAAENIAHWHPIVAPHRALRIGLKWRANETTGSEKSVPIQMLLPAVRREGVELVALEKELLEDDLRFLQEFGGVSLLGGRLRDFSDTAAVISMLDLVLSVDTSVAHLAGAMAKPVWILLQFAADWRWLRGRQDSPWYPSARLFRQPAAGAWANVLAAVSSEMEALVARGSTG